MITELHRLPSLPWTPEDYQISRERLTLWQRLQYLAADARDAAQMYALGDDHESERVSKTATLP